MTKISTDSPNPREISAPCAKSLLEAREEITDTFIKRVRKEVSAAKNLDLPIIVNSMPYFLDNLAEALDPDFPRSLATEGSTISQEHGGERARLTRYNPEHLIQEYQILRDTIFQVLQKRINLSKAEENIIIKSIDSSIIESMAAYFIVLTNIREQYIATLTHDLRTPINVARMACEIIEMESPKIEVKALTERIITNMKRADRMIQNLLDATSFGIGEKLHLKISFCDFGSIVQSILQQLPKEQAERVVVSPTEAQGFWDADALHRAFENLINNAFKYGSSEGKVTVKYHPLHEKVFFAVHNEGPSIPAEEQEGLFQAFRRGLSAKRGENKGWGVGLALARGVAEAHGGSIVIDSAPDRGTTFTIDLPRDSRRYIDAAVPR